MRILKQFVLFVSSKRVAGFVKFYDADMVVTHARSLAHARSELQQAQFIDVAFIELDEYREVEEVCSMLKRRKRRPTIAVVRHPGFPEKMCGDVEVRPGLRDEELIGTLKHLRSGAMF